MQSDYLKLVYKNLEIIYLETSWFYSVLMPKIAHLQSVSRRIPAKLNLHKKIRFSNACFDWQLSNRAHFHLSSLNLHLLKRSLATSKHSRFLSANLQPDRPLFWKFLQYILYVLFYPTTSLFRACLSLKLTSQINFYCTVKQNIARQLQNQKHHCQSQEQSL